MSAVKVFKHFETPKEYGVHFRLLCLTGENKGVAYFLTGQRVILGRSEKADIVLKDLKSSREHAELVVNEEDYIVTDLGSQNGIVVNDLKVKQHKLKDGDKLIIGSTVFKFGKVIVEENIHKKNMEKLQGKLDEEKGKPKLEEPVKKKRASLINDVEDNPKKKIKPIHFIIGAALLAVLFMDDEDPGNKAKGKKQTNYKINEVSSEFESALRKRQFSQDKELQTKLDTIFQKGLREFREENYFRAMSEFNLALVLSPNDGQAQYYLQKTRDALDKKIESFKIKAKRDEGSLKYNSAVISYCSIIRLLYNYPEDERYKEAEESIRELEKKMDKEENEINCVQK
jgi:pSer/pThr/pTyr-binding forkhead associated (FHA) protein